MNTAGEQVRALTGATVALVDDATVETLLRGHGVEPYSVSFPMPGIYRASADLLTRLATSVASVAQVRQVEDVSVEPRRPADLLTLAREFRAHADQLEDDAAPPATVVEFHPWGQ